MPSSLSLHSEMTSAGEDYYPSPLHEEARARLAYLATKPLACGLLLGPGGCGKTLVLSLFSQQERKAGASVAALSALGASARDLLLELGAAWGADVRAGDELQNLWRKTTGRLRELHYEQTPALLLVDDLHQALSEGAALIDRVQAFAEVSEVNLVLIAACQDRCQDLLPPRFLARAQLRMELDTWTLEETASFLHQWLSHNVAEDQEFDSQAIEVLHELAEGVPRRVRRLAELAAFAGKRNGTQLSEDVVRCAYDELISP